MRVGLSWTGLVPCNRGSRALLAPSTRWGDSEKMVALNQEGSVTRRQPCWHLDLGLPASTTVSNTFQLFISHPASAVLLQQPKWTETTHDLTRCNSCKYFAIFALPVCVCMYIFSWAIESMQQNPWHFSPKYLSVDPLRTRTVSSIIVPLSHLRKLLMIP